MLTNNALRMVSIRASCLPFLARGGLTDYERLGWARKCNCTKNIDVKVARGVRGNRWPKGGQLPSF